MSALQRFLALVPPPRPNAPRWPVAPDIVAFLVLRAKERILADRRAGVVPTVRSFSELHDYVDANTYLLTRAGHFDMALQNFAEEHGGPLRNSVAPDGTPYAWQEDYQEVLNANLNAAVDAVDRWLKTAAPMS